MKSFIQPIIIIFYFLSSFTFANSPFEIPRSQVIELKDSSTARVYPIFIKLPRSYHSNPNKKYPVIYLTDALYSFQVVSGATRYPMNSGIMEEAIIVGVSYSKGSKGASSRIRDYTPSKANSWKMETGNAAGHANFIRETVFPYIESNYRAMPSQRTYIGNSLGGLFGAYMLFTTPSMFNHYILGSPSIWFNNNSVLSIDISKVKYPIKVYIAVGSQETPKFGERENMVLGAKELAQKIKVQGGNNIELKLIVIDGASHATAFPTTSIQGLDWLYRKK